MLQPGQAALLRLDLNNPVFRGHLLTLLRLERHAALEALNKLRQTTWLKHQGDFRE